MKIGIIFSPDYGAGWSTWGDDESCLDQELAWAIDAKASKEVIESIAEKNWPGQYTGGLEDARVCWVEEGTRFRITEYDGWESIEFEDSDFWRVAK